MSETSKTIRMSLEDLETLELISKLSGMKAQLFLHEFLVNCRKIVNGFGTSGYRLSVLSIELPYQKPSGCEGRVFTYFAKISVGKFETNANDSEEFCDRKLKKIISKREREHE